MTALIILCFSGCNNLNSNQKLKVTDIPWKVKMGINYLDDRAAMVEYTNNTEYTITEISLTFKMKENIKTEELDGFYSYLSKEYQLSQDDVNELKNESISMNSHAYLDKEEFLQKGDKHEESLCYGIKFIRNLDYYKLFEPDMYIITYLNESGEEHTTFYDYINKQYTNQ